MAETDLDVVRRGYAAFIAGDLAALRELFAEDATWVVPGSSPTSGTKEGRDAIMAHLVDLVTRTDGTFRVTQVALAEGDGHVFSLDRSEATRNGASMESTGVNVLRLREGRVHEVQQFFDDTTAADAFWA